MFTTSIIDNSVVTIMQVYKYNNVIITLFEKLEDYIDWHGRIWKLQLPDTLTLNLWKGKQVNSLLELTLPPLMSITPFCTSNLDNTPI